MTLEVVLAGPMRRPPGLVGGTAENPAMVEVPEGATVADLLLALGFAAGEVRFFRASVDGALVGPDRRLFPGERVALLLPMGGG